MSEQEKIKQRVLKLRVRKRAQVIADYVVRGLFWGALPAALAVFATKLWIIPARLWIVPINQYLVGAALLVRDHAGLRHPRDAQAHHPVGRGQRHRRHARPARAREQRVGAGRAILRRGDACVARQASHRRQEQGQPERARAKRSLRARTCA